MALTIWLTSIAWCYGDVKNKHLYRLGEDDGPCAKPLAPGCPITIDGIAAANAQKVGLTFYDGMPSLGGPPVNHGLAPNSTEAMRFTNVDSRYVAPLAQVTQNFGMEAYVQISTGVTNARFFYNGNGTTRGYGLGIVKGFYAALVGTGKPSFVPTPVVANPSQAVVMALVNSATIVPSSNQACNQSFPGVYVYIQGNCVLHFKIPNSFKAPTAADVLSIGSFAGTPKSPPGYVGIVDEARVFTFEPAGFTPMTDLARPAK
jgi:hypothetical protein